MYYILSLTKPCGVGIIWVFQLENDVDGDALMTLVGLTPGPDCLKELIPKIGTRMKVYKLIKAYYDESFVCCTF